MKGLVLHTTTRKQLELFLTRPAHALLLLGPDGVGKGSVAQLLMSRLLAISVGKLANYPYAKILQPANGTISIDTVRDVQKFLQLKTMGSQQIRRIVCLEHADGMTQEAQNALLKILEEPPADTIIILTAQAKRALLPTILSRVQVLTVVEPAHEQLEAHFSDQGPSDDIRKAYFLSGGLPGLMHSILADDQEHPLLKQVATAKELLQKPIFERLTMIDSLAKQKESTTTLLDALARIAQSGLTQAGKTGNTKQIRQWHTVQKEIFAAQGALAKSANSKLVLTNMFLNF